MNSTVSKEIDVKIAEVKTKNFIVSFSNNSIDVGDIFEIDFSKTTGEVEYFNVKVLYQTGLQLIIRLVIEPLISHLRSTKQDLILLT